MSKCPILGSAFDPDQMNDIERVQAYVDELRYYRPRGFGKLAREGEEFIQGSHIGAGADFHNEWFNDCDALLTDWARRVERHDYISFGPFDPGGAVGFYVSAESAREEADLIVDDLSEVPRGFTGLVVGVTDHGNVYAYRYSRGKSRELFAVV